MTRLSLPALFALVLLSAVIAVTFGPAEITPGEVWSAILHHFGSREKLVTEVVQRRIEAMNQ